MFLKQNLFFVQTLGPIKLYLPRRRRLLAFVRCISFQKLASDSIKDEGNLVSLLLIFDILELLSGFIVSIRMWIIVLLLGKTS